MTIQHQEDGNQGIFYVAQNGEELAEMTYTLEKGKMVIQHTEVDESLRGKNIGLQLVKHAVAYARQKSFKIEPLCTFAAKVLQNTEQFQDVL